MVGGLTRWLTAGATVVGRAHLAEGRGCQDRVAAVERNGIVALALADGAGSVRFGELGAELAVDTAITSLLMGASVWELPDARERLVETVVAALTERACVLGCEPGELSTTLLFAAIDGDRFLCGQIGDGVLAVQHGDAWRVAWPPTRGEHANETVFVTSRDAVVHCRWNAGLIEDRRGLALMSDGSAEVLHDRAKNVVAPAVDSISSWLAREASTSVERGIARSMEELFRARTADDCGLVLARQVTLDSAEVGNRSREFQCRFLGCATPRSVPQRLRVLAAVERLGPDAQTALLAWAAGVSVSSARRHRVALGARVEARRSAGVPHAAAIGVHQFPDDAGG